MRAIPKGGGVVDKEKGAGPRGFENKVTSKKTRTPGKGLQPKLGKMRKKRLAVAEGWFVGGTISLC